MTDSFSRTCHLLCNYPGATRDRLNHGATRDSLILPPLPRGPACFFTCVSPQPFLPLAGSRPCSKNLLDRFGQPSRGSYLVDLPLFPLHGCLPRFITVKRFPSYVVAYVQFSGLLDGCDLALWAYPLRVSAGKDSRNPRLLVTPRQRIPKSTASRTRHSGLYRPTAKHLMIRQTFDKPDNFRHAICRN